MAQNNHVGDTNEMITAVEWLIQQEFSNDYFSNETINKAKQMENEQRNKDLKTGYNQGYIDAQCNHINDADNFTHEYLNH